MTKSKKKGLALHWKIIIGLIAGILWAYMSIAVGLNEITQNWISPFGDIFIRMLKFIAIPLVLFSIITGISSLKDVTKLGRMGAKTFAAYLLTTVIAVTVGLVIVNLFKPGNTISEEQKVRNRISYELWVMSEPEIEFKDDIRLSQDPQYASVVQDIIDNPEEIDEKVLSMQETVKSSKDEGPLQSLVDMVPENLIVSLSNPKLMLQVIFFSLFFGITLLFIDKEKADPVNKFFDGINEVFLKMVDFVMKAAPFFVFALMAGVLTKMASNTEDLMNLLLSQGAYCLVVIGGLFFMVAVYPLVVTLFVKRIKYREFWRKISPAQLMAFSTSSSAATLPVTMECVEDGVGVKPTVTSFVLPIGATVNMDGTSLYQAVAVIFLAQLHGVDIGLGEQAIIVLTATLASIGSAAVPSAGLFMLMVVLMSVGLNPLWIAIILPVDRILDMCRTVVNVTGDATVSTIIAASEGELKDEVEQGRVDGQMENSQG